MTFCMCKFSYTKKNIIFHIKERKNICGNVLEMENHKIFTYYFALLLKQLLSLLSEVNILHRALLF